MFYYRQTKQSNKSLITEAISGVLIEKHFTQAEMLKVNIVRSIMYCLKSVTLHPPKSWCQGVFLLLFPPSPNPTERAELTIICIIQRLRLDK